MTIIQANKFYYLRGGAERYMLELSAWLSEHGHEVIPFAMEYKDNIETPWSEFFVSAVDTERASIGWQGARTFTRMLYSLQARRKLASLIVKSKPDICHIHNIYTQISPSILHTLKSQNVPVVMTVHDTHVVSPQYNIWAENCGKDYRNVGVVRGTLARFHKRSATASFAQVLTHKFHRWLKIYERGVDMFICPSEYMKRQLVTGGIDRSRVRVVRYGIDLNSIEPRYEHNGYFLYVGRLSEEKGVETIIRLAEIMPDIQFKIVGRGPNMDRLHSMGHKFDNLEFLGFRVGDELRKLYRGATAVLLPSRVHENFPLSLLESMAAGTPVIASDVGGVSEIVEDRVSGFLVPPTNLKSWTESVLRIYHDADLQNSMARSSRRIVEERFPLQRHLSEIMNIYQEVIDRNRYSPPKTKSHILTSSFHL